MKEVPVKVPQSTYSAQEFTEGVSQESQNVVRDTHQTLDENDLHQMTQGISILSSSKTQYINTGSTVNNYVVSSVNLLGGNTQLKQYFNGMTVTFQVPINATGDCTLNVDGLGIVPLLRFDGSAVSTQILDVTFPHYLTVRYSNGDFLIMKANANDEVYRNNLASNGGAGLIGTTEGITVQQKLNNLTAEDNNLQNQINILNGFPKIHAWALWQGAAGLGANVGFASASPNGLELNCVLTSGAPAGIALSCMIGVGIPSRQQYVFTTPSQFTITSEVLFGVNSMGVIVI